MRRSISAQSCASVPPVPAWIVTTASPASYSPEKSASSCSGRARARAAERRLDLGGHVPVQREELAARPRTRGEPLVALEPLLDTRVLGRIVAAALLVVPEAGLAHRRSSSRTRASSPSGVKGNHGPSRAGPRSPPERSSTAGRRPSRRCERRAASRRQRADRRWSARLRQWRSEHCRTQRAMCAVVVGRAPPGSARDAARRRARDGVASTRPGRRSGALVGEVGRARRAILRRSDVADRCSRPSATRRSSRRIRRGRRRSSSKDVRGRAGRLTSGPTA